MAALSIAFEAPDNSHGYSHAQPRPINLVHLANFAKGDKQRELEALQAFARQARGCLNEFVSSDLGAVATAAARLKHAAESVGADRVVEAAERMEQEGIDATTLAVASAAIVETENFISKLCRC